VRDAQDETEQRRRIAELFDTERMEAELLTTIKKLKQNQQADGGWGWFNGLRSDLYITRHIVAGFGKLRTMGVWQLDADTRDMLAKAVKFMDEEVVEYHKNTIKEKNRVPDWFELHSAYARSFWLKDFKCGDGRRQGLFRHSFPHKTALDEVRCCAKGACCRDIAPQRHDQGCQADAGVAARNIYQESWSSAPIGPWTRATTGIRPR
jgi:hypothetical protein